MVELREDRDLQEKKKVTLYGRYKFQFLLDLSRSIRCAG